jgi:hypothetical protein
VEKSVVHVAQTIGIVVVILNIKQACQQFKICFITVSLPSVMAMLIRQTIEWWTLPTVKTRDKRQATQHGDPACLAIRTKELK